MAVSLSPNGVFFPGTFAPEMVPGSPTDVAPLPGSLSTNPDPTDFEAASKELLGEQATIDQYTANQNAQKEAAIGAAAEVNAYQNAYDITTTSANLEAVSGQIQQVQQQRQVAQTIGSQKAQVASAGFGHSGTALDLLRSSYQQGYLGAQLIGVQSEIQQNGLLEQGAAAKAEMASASAAETAANDLAAQYAKAGTIATATQSLTTSQLKLINANAADQASQFVGDANAGNVSGEQAVLDANGLPTGDAASLSASSNVKNIEAFAPRSAGPVVAGPGVTTSYRITPALTPPNLVQPPATIG